MTDHTPTTEEVREQYTREQPPHMNTVSGKTAEFDRWLTAHDRKIVVKALRDAAWQNVPGELSKQDRRLVEEWLTARADLIEQGGM